MFTKKIFYSKELPIHAFRKLQFFIIILSQIFLLQIFSQELPLGYRNIRLGLSLEEAKELLKKDTVFGYRGDRDVSLLPTQERILIETAGGNSFLERCWFQFYNDSLYIITININQEKMDYYSLFSTLTKKYGEPMSLSPDKSQWENDEVIMSLEKPRTLKYVDKKVFTELQKQSTIQQSGIEYTRELFLEEL